MRELTRKYCDCSSLLCQLKVTQTHLRDEVDYLDARVDPIMYLVM